MDRAACYDVPLWHRTLWEEADRSDESIARASVGDERAAGFSDGFQPELFHRLYSEDPNNLGNSRVNPAAAVRQKLHDLASELPEFSTLRRRTVHDPMWAAIATDAVAGTLVDALPERLQSPDADAAIKLLADLQSLTEGVKQVPEWLASQIAEAAGVAGGTAFAVGEQAEALDESNLRTALRAGIQAAHDAIAEAQSALTCFGGESGEANGGAVIAPGVAIELARRVKNSSKLRRVVELAGRLQTTARAKRASRTEYARAETVGVTLTGDVGRLLPMELGALAHPLRAVDLFRRVSEKTALGYDVRGREKTAKGPIVVSLDISSSMNEDGGAKDTWAKAVSLAVLDIARHERRAFAVCLFNHELAGTYYAPDTSKAKPLEILDLLSTAPHGGTMISTALTWALDTIEHARAGAAFKQADVVLVTDGEASGADLGHALDLAKRADRIGAHVFGIAIGDGGGTLRSFARDVACIDDVSRDTQATDLIFEGL